MARGGGGRLLQVGARCSKSIHVEAEWVFTIVKPYFLRSGRVLVRYFFVLCFWIDTFRVFVVDFLGFVGPWNLHRGPNGSVWETLRGQIWA